MRKVVICALLYYGIVTINGNGDMGKGRWRVKYIENCEEDNHKFQFDINQSKINRTHDGFNVKMLLKTAFTDEYPIHVDICKEVDGGCKPYQVLTDNSFVNFVTKYAEGNVKTCLELAGVDPPEFPVPAGEYKVENYIFNYEELPEDAMFGDYGARCVMLEGMTEVSCVMAYIEFVPLEEGDEE